jgi:hypothetical protein
MRGVVNTVTGWKSSPSDGRRGARRQEDEFRSTESCCRLARQRDEQILDRDRLRNEVLLEHVLDQCLLTVPPDLLVAADELIE